MEFSIIVTDITPAGYGKVYVSGVTSTGETVRLQPPLRERFCMEKKISPGVHMIFEGENYGVSPFIEDCFCEQILSIAPGHAKNFHRVLGITTQTSVAAAFGSPIIESKYIVRSAQPQRSLMTVRVLKSRIKATPDNRASHAHIMRLVFCDAKEWFNLPIVQDFWYRAAQKNRVTALQALSRYLTKYEAFYIRLLLSRVEEERFWLQVSGIYGMS